MLHFTKGQTQVIEFWGDVHVNSVRADEVINNMADAKEIMNRFRLNPEIFDHMDYTGHSKAIKANREYYSEVERKVNRMEIEFMFNGKLYKTNTKKITVKGAIEEHADEVLKVEEVTYLAKVRDDNGEIIEIIEEQGRTAYYIEDNLAFQI